MRCQSWSVFCRIDDLEARKVALKALTVPRDKRPAPDFGLRTNQEVGQDSGPLAAAPPIFGKGLPSAKRVLAVKGGEHYVQPVKRRTDLGKCRKTGCKLLRV